MVGTSACIHRLFTSPPTQHEIVILYIVRLFTLELRLNDCRAKRNNMLEASMSAGTVVSDVRLNLHNAVVLRVFYRCTVAI